MGTMKVGGTKFEIAKYDGRTYYLLWEQKVKGMLKATDSSKLLKTKPEDVPVEDWNDMQERAVNTIMLQLQPHVIRQLEKYGDCSSLFEALQRKYHQKELSNQLYTFLKLMSFKMKDGNMKSSLPPSYKNLSQVLLHRDRRTITYNEVVSALKTDELQQKMMQQSLSSTLSGVALNVNRADRVLQVKARDKAVLKGNKHRNLYVLEGNTVCGEVNVTRSRPEMAQIWHSIMGHMSDSRLRIFGCMAYPLIPKKHMTKLDTTSKKCCFLGYASGVKGYRLWDHVACKELEEQEVIDEPLIRAPNDRDQPKMSTRRSLYGVSRAPTRYGSWVNSFNLHDQELEDRDDDGNALILEEGEPSSYREAQASTDKLEWDAAMERDAIF
ncbi:hypothetical protein AXG93_4259s1010 [Marchantia polymorpha subsp. ruderalis]|uniref:Retroviral polymerase SH3-like domain-containing protein n=1 Tax=Marchantia polymorpha subsp. ruderalis TaxID=1480154 RepID=A0A176WRZ4_MARPO|nr:hypothetical protein AXG93_4259s1010 [Marchantia polymorpha subsp. ruderalis]